MKIVVIGRNYMSLLGMIRAVGIAGHEVIAIRTVKGLKKDGVKSNDSYIEKTSRYVKEHYVIEQDRNKLIRFLLEEIAEDGSKMVLIPVDDFVASTIDLNLINLRDYFVFPSVNNEPGEVVKLMDKNFQKKLAKECGLTVVEGWKIDICNGQYTIPSGIKYPVFTKPEISYLGNKRCMKKCNNEKELKDVINFILTGKECPLLVEQFIDIEQEYALLGCVVDGKVYIPGLIHMIRDGSGAHKGVTMIGNISPLDPSKETFELLKKYIARTEFNGLFDIDLYESKGQLYFNELNLRFGASGYALTASGVNLPGLWIDSLNKNRVLQLENTDIRNSVFVNEKVVYDDYFGGYISKKEAQNFINSADIRFLESKADMSPSIIFSKEIRKSDLIFRFKQIIRSFLRRVR